MTLATRCSACGTSFRVVQDQLKVSGGWVRCGRCNEVFNALESLYEIEAQGSAPAAAPQTPAPPPPPAPATPPAPPPPRPATTTTPASPVSLWERRTAESPALPPSAPQPADSHPSSLAGGTQAGDGTSGESQKTVAPSTAEQSPDSTQRFHQEPSGSLAVGGSAHAPMQKPAWVPFGGVWPRPDQDSTASPDAPPPATWSAPGAKLASEEVSPEVSKPSTPTWRPPAPSEPAEWDDRPVHGFEDVETRLEPRPGEDIGPTPSFLQTPQHQAPHGNGQRRRWMAITSVLCALLVLQFMLAWRDSLAARVPSLEPVLRLACVPFACSVDAPRNLAAMALEGSNLRQRGGVGNGYELVVALRNRSAASVMWPSFELTLTDSQGQALIRRVLSPQDFGVLEKRLGPAAEFNLSTQLDVADRRISGYTVEIFYP